MRPPCRNIFHDDVCWYSRMASFFSSITGSHFFSLATLAAIALVVWWLEDIVHTAGDVAAHGDADLPDFYLEDFVLHQYDQAGSVAYRAQGRSMASYSGNNSTVIDTVFLQQFPEQPSAVTMTADQARLLDDGERIDLMGSVHIYRAEGGPDVPFDIRTERLFIDQTSGYMESAEPVTMKTPGHEISGIGMQAWTESGRYRLLSRVKGRHEP